MNETALSAHCFHVKFCSPYGDQLKGYWKGSVRMSAVVPRQNALGSRKRGGRDRNGERAAKRLFPSAGSQVNLLMGKASWLHG